MMTPTKKRIFLREVHRVVEWRDGCAYRYEKVGMVYAHETPLRPGVAVLVPPS